MGAERTGRKRGRSYPTPSSSIAASNKKKKGDGGGRGCGRGRGAGESDANDASSTSGGGGVGGDGGGRRGGRTTSTSSARATTRTRSTSTATWDVDLETLMPQARIDLIADLGESILEDPISSLTSTRSDVTNAGGGGGGGGGGNTNRGGKRDDDGDGGGIEGGVRKAPLYRKTPSKMSKLLDLSTPSINGHDAHAARMGLLSLLAIFKDILPSYRIRLPTESELSVRVSAETKATWDHERRLLQYYQRYLQLLERTWEEGKVGRRWDGGGDGGGAPSPPTTLAATAILSLSSLLRTCYNFNFRANLLRVVVRQANRRSSSEIRIACCDALSHMFVSDVMGEASLEAVRMMSRMIKEREQRGNPTVHPDAIDTWLSLPLRVHEDEAAAARLAIAAKAKNAKRSEAAKVGLDIEREMKEGDANVDRLELARNQADALHAISLAYFRILKSVSSVVVRRGAGGEDGDVDGRGKRTGDHRSTSTSELALLPCALRGLAKFSHLIHLDAVVDLLAVLKELLKNASSLPPDVAIDCILCALKTLRGPGREALPVDPKEYLIPLYNILPRLGCAKNAIGHGGDGDDAATNSGYGGRGGTIEAAIQCLDHAFLHRRELSTSRLAAFVKRLVTASLHCPPQSSVPLLACARQISSRYSNSSSSKLIRMLENEDDVVAEGVFAPDAEDPEHSNAHATSLWELALMKYAIHPAVAEQSSMMAEGRPPKLPAESPCRIWAGMCRDAREGYIPSNGVAWKRHPLDNAKGRSSNQAEEVVDGSRWKRRQQRRNRDQIRFITPRRTGGWHLLPATSYSML